MVERLLDLDRAYGLEHIPGLEPPSRVATVATAALINQLPAANYVKPATAQEAAARALSNLDGRPTDLQQYSFCLLSILHNPPFPTLPTCKAAAAAAALYLRSEVELLRENAVRLLCGCLKSMSPSDRTGVAEAVETMFKIEFCRGKAQEYIYQRLAARV